MRRNHLIALATLGSAALLLGAWGFQYLGYAPCKMCLWQRWPHGAAVLFGVAAMAAPVAILTLAGALAAATTGAIGVYHTGVERGWWEGPSSCSSGDITGMSTDDLFNQIMAAPLVRCDEVAWQLLGLSMASWNALISFALVAIWLAAYRKSAP
ncbi:Periplasmic thiol:disulfide oxidoreductase DsbB [Candidatus Rhodobacter oscarellae]|uniref:Periplasmic thiol:disulfide oxidoreductase DsbB n=1 Tax=Candidatus Rhodobacter oscarellae TaxID=1675527 RepID=A0A0J9E3Y5_9RHOB|nr:disulfide bond formation protein B [Candidatus Rhodobacter lobularis]KMW57422.1 Periplasmic thiol:disulfide oxidoreductase DsbB [Candidatus Rhodobacter lobularis]